MRRTLGPALAAGLLGSILLAGSALAAPDVGQHIHDTILNDPVRGQVIPRAPYTFRHEIRLHDMPAKATSLRVADYNTVKRTQSISLGPCSDCVLSVAFTVDFSSWSCGEHELRWTVNVPSQSGSARHYTTTRSYVTLAGCTTKRHDRPSDWHGGGGNWYEHYDITILGTPEASVRAGAAIRVRSQSGATGGCLFVNPDFHHGSHGTQVGSCWSGTSWVTRTMPSTLRDGDRVVLMGRSGEGAGLYGFVVGDAADGVARHEWQAWWNDGGIRLP